MVYLLTLDKQFYKIIEVLNKFELKKISTNDCKIIKLYSFYEIDIY